jgi:hypothetical protein
VEIVGIVDSDYVVSPEWLRSCVGPFRDPTVAFVQSPQDYREVSPDDRYAVACYRAYQFFFKISMASRNEHNGIIFAGTMGLVRRDVLDEVGGWDYGRAGLRCQISNLEWRGPTAWSIGVDGVGQGNADTDAIQGGGSLECALVRSRVSLNVRGGYKESASSDGGRRQGGYVGGGIYKRF